MVNVEAEGSGITEVKLHPDAQLIYYSVPSVRHIFLKNQESLSPQNILISSTLNLTTLGLYNNSLINPMDIISRPHQLTHIGINKLDGTSARASAFEKLVELKE